MARHSGKNGKVKLASGFVAGLTSWDIEETVGDADLTAAEDVWSDHDTTQKSWTGNIAVKLDHGADGQTVRAGDVLAFEGYTEGDGTGKTFYSGQITVLTHGITSPFDGEVTRSYSFKGKGALASAVVA
jgi:hypothetical protein